MLCIHSLIPLKEIKSIAAADVPAGTIITEAAEVTGYEPINDEIRFIVQQGENIFEIQYLKAAVD